MFDWPRNFDQFRVRTSAAPYEVFVAMVSFLPAIAVMMFMAGCLDVPTVLVELSNHFFVFLWGALSGLSSLFIWWGVITDHAKPVIVGLRLSAFVWGAYIILIFDNTSTMRGIIFEASGIFAIAISLLHSFKLSGRMKYLWKVAKRTKTEG